MIGLIWSGIMLYLYQPVQTETSSRAFADWLETTVKKGDVETLQKQIYQLKKTGGSLNTLIQEASRIVSRHNDEFNLPLDERNSDSDQIYNLLISEWNSYQAGNGMGKASVPKTVISNLHPKVDKFAHSLSGKIERTANLIGFPDLLGAVAATLSVFYAIEPLSGGIAIGAP